MTSDNERGSGQDRLRWLLANYDAYSEADEPYLFEPGLKHGVAEEDIYHW
jgi:hypothetical protein